MKATFFHSWNPKAGKTSPSVAERRDDLQAEFQRFGKEADVLSLGYELTIARPYLYLWYSGTI